jgi:hypothetical protein
MKVFLKIFLTLLLIAIVITNIFPVLSDWKWYHYTTKDGKFQFDEFPAKERDLQMMHRVWKSYKQINQPTDTVIYRTFIRNPLKFWEWRDYFENPRYQYPYLNPQKIGNN